jgi:hypothetical protein
MEFFSYAQLTGYVAFVLGVLAFLQKSDRRLKVLIATESLVYGVHFVLLGNSPAAATAVIAGFRSLLALKTRSLTLAVVVVAVNIAVGAALAGTGPGWLPVVATCSATVAMFTMQGVSLRLVLLTSTTLWLVNNILSGSIGGTALELVIAAVNGSTVVRMFRSRAAAGAASTASRRGVNAPSLPRPHSILGYRGVRNERLRNAYLPVLRGAEPRAGAPLGRYRTLRRV